MCPSLNLDGSLSALSSLSSLRSMTLICLGSDAGLQHMRQLRSLAVVLPDDHGDCNLAALTCPGCGEVHMEDLEEHLMDVYSNARAVVLGRNICALPTLETLTIDYHGIYSLGINPTLNIFSWEGAQRGACMPALTTLKLSGLSHGLSSLAWQLEAGPDFSGARLAPDLAKLGTAFDAMTALRRVEMELVGWLPEGAEEAQFAVKSGQLLQGTWTQYAQAGERSPKYCITLVKPTASEI